MEQSRKQQILGTAQKMMRESGFHGTSMRDIAAALNMEAASLYNHISGKDEILKSTCFDLAERFVHAMAEVNDIYFGAIEKLQMAVKNHIQLLTENLDASFVFIHEWRNLNEPLKSDFVRLRDNYENAFREILQNGEDEGVFKEVDQKFAVLTLLSSMNWVVEWYNPQGKMSPAEIAEKLTDFILSGLKK